MGHYCILFRIWNNLGFKFAQVGVVACLPFFLEKRGLKIKDEEKTLHYVKMENTQKITNDSMHIILKVACLQKIILYVIIITFPTHAILDGEISLSAYKISDPFMHLIPFVNPTLFFLIPILHLQF
ncbi:hypothetical protein ACJX0J_019323 [Zea mays]